MAQTNRFFSIGPSETLMVLIFRKSSSNEGSSNHSASSSLLRLALRSSSADISSWDFGPVVFATLAVLVWLGLLGICVEVPASCSGEHYSK